MCVFSVDINLREELHSFRDPVVGRDEFLDIGFASWFLLAELVARERQHPEALAMVLLSKAGHCLVTPVRETSFRRDVYNVANVALILLEIELVPVDIFGRKAEEVTPHSSFRISSVR